jgi:sulfate adenylyltransferase subunit 1
MASYLDMELLRFTTAGSVDDGKSTLIGRLLYDSKSIFEDQLEAVKAAGARLGNTELNLALLTDGLRAEREQGITIDVAYRYFATPRRKFIIADTPGHIEYTRNMVTGASTADAAVILVDARNGIVEQTRRHSCIAALLQLPDVVVAVNKMDLVGFSESAFEKIRAEYGQVASKLGLKRVYYIPISAREGDNVVNASPHMPWFKGKPLLELLEELPVGGESRAAPGRFPVQYVIRPQKDEFHDYRAYAGRIAAGHFKVGDHITVLPSHSASVITAIEEMGVELESAWAPESVSIRLRDDIDVSRGDMIVKEDELPQSSTEVTLLLCWLNHQPLRAGSKYIVRHTTNELPGIVKEIQSRIDVNTLDEVAPPAEIHMNDIARIRLKTAKPLHYDPYSINRATGSLVLIHPDTFETVAAAMLL